MTADPYNTQDIEHARLAVTLTVIATASGEPKWRWVPAMMDTNLHRITHVHGDGYATTDKSGVQSVPLHGRLPLLSDHGTLGALEYRLVPDAWGADVTIINQTGPVSPSITVVDRRGTRVAYADGGTIGSRWVSILEAAP